MVGSTADPLKIYYQTLSSVLPVPQKVAPEVDHVVDMLEPRKISSDQHTSMSQCMPGRRVTPWHDTEGRSTVAVIRNLPSAGRRDVPLAGCKKPIILTSECNLAAH